MPNALLTHSTISYNDLLYIIHNSLFYLIPKSFFHHGLSGGGGGVGFSPFYWMEWVGQSYWQVDAQSELLFV